MHGLKVGEVTDVGLVYDPKKDRIVVPVHYRVEADRIAGIAAAQGMPRPLVAEDMVKRGLRATLQSPSLITGQKIVALDSSLTRPRPNLSTGRRCHCHADIGGRRLRQHHPVGQRTPGQDQPHRLRRHRQRASRAPTRGLDDTINGPQLKKTLAALEAAMVDVQDIAKKLDTDATPALKRLPEIAAQLQEALTKANRLIGSLNTGYGDDSRFRRDLDRLLPQLTDTARSIRALADLLSRHPEALIKGRTNTGKE